MLAAGHFSGCKRGESRPREGRMPCSRGDLVSILIGPRDGNHSCDLTAVDLTLAGGGREWNLAREVSPDILAGNPHADTQGHPASGIFTASPTRAAPTATVPAGSLLARWQSAATRTKSNGWRQAIQELLEPGPPAAKDSPDARLYRQLASLRGPLVSAVSPDETGSKQVGDGGRSRRPGDGARRRLLFGKHPGGPAIDDASIACRPQVLEIRLPADLVAGCEFVDRRFACRRVPVREGSVQLQLRARRRGIAGGDTRPAGHRPRRLDGAADGSSRRSTRSARSSRRPFATPRSCRWMRSITLTLFYREDGHLRRLMLDEAEAGRARPALGRASFREPGCAHAGRCVSAAHGICDAGRRPQGFRADAQADQRPGRGISPASWWRPSRVILTR